MTQKNVIIKSPHTGQYLCQFCPGCGHDYLGPPNCGRTGRGCSTCGHPWPDFTDLNAALNYLQTLQPDPQPQAAQRQAKPKIADDVNSIAARMRELGLQGDAGMEARFLGLGDVYKEPSPSNRGNYRNLGSVKQSQRRDGYLTYRLDTQTGEIFEFDEGSAAPHDSVTPDFLRKQAKAWLHIAKLADGKDE